MKLIYSSLSILLLLSAPFADAVRGSRVLKSSKSSSLKKSSKKKGMDTKMVTLKVTNLSYQQPFSPFFVMVHNSDAGPLYVPGQEASSALAILAEDGDPSKLRHGTATR